MPLTPYRVDKGIIRILWNYNTRVENQIEVEIADDLEISVENRHFTDDFYSFGSGIVLFRQVRGVNEFIFVRFFAYIFGRFNQLYFAMGYSNPICLRASSIIFMTFREFSCELTSD